MCADKRVGRSGASCKAKETRGCQVLAHACWQSSAREWKVKQVSYEYSLCSGGTTNASSRALRPEATKFSRPNKNRLWKTWGGGGLIWNLMETDTAAQYAPVEGGGERKSYPLLTFHTNNTGGVDAFSHNVSHT